MSLPHSPRASPGSALLTLRFFWGNPAPRSGLKLVGRAVDSQDVQAGLGPGVLCRNNLLSCLSGALGVVL